MKLWNVAYKFENNDGQDEAGGVMMVASTILNAIDAFQKWGKPDYEITSMMEIFPASDVIVGE